MSNNAAESDTFPASVIEPQLNDLDYFNSVPQGMTALASRTRFLYNGATGNVPQDTLGLANVTLPTPGFVSVPVPAAARLGAQEPVGAATLALLKNIAHLRSYMWGAEVNADGQPFEIQLLLASISATWAGDFVPSLSANIPSLTQSGLTGAAVYLPILGLPPRGSITEVTCSISPAGGHGAVPLNKPILTLFRLAGGSATQVATLTDPSSTLGAYGPPHLIQIAGLSEQISEGVPYYVAITGESSTNAIAGLKLTRVYIRIGP